MSYSFSIKATSKRAASAAVATAFERIVDEKPEHAFDAPTAIATAAAMIALLPDDDTMDVAVGMYGSARIRRQPQVITGAGLTVNAYLTPRT